MKKEDEEEKSIKNKNLDGIRLKLIPKCQKLLNDTEQNIKLNIKKGKEKSLQIIETELNNRKGQLNKVDESVATAANKLQIKIEKVIKEVIEVQEKEISILKNLIENLAKENIRKLEGKEDPTLKIETNKGFEKKLIVSTILGVSLYTGLPFLGEAMVSSGSDLAFSTAVGGVIAGPIGHVIGGLVGISISIGTLIVNNSNKEKRYIKALEQLKEDIVQKFDECEKDFLENYILYKNQFLKAFAIKIQIINKDIDTVDEKKCEEIIVNYIQKKNKIIEKITSLKLDDN